MNCPPFRFTVGAHEGYILNDAAVTHAADGPIVNPDLAALEQLPDTFSFNKNEIPVHYNNLLIKTGAGPVLVDAGLPRPNGRLPAGLEPLKIDPGEIKSRAGQRHS